MTTAEMIAEFHHAFGQSFGDEPDYELRARLHDEENRELTYELECGTVDTIAKELADVVYIAYGTAFALGIDLDAVLAAVHASNMTKRGPDGAFVVRDDGKVMKGPHYREPNIAAVLAEQASS